MSVREDLLRELWSLYSNESEPNSGPGNFFAAHTLRCFSKGNTAFLSALSQLRHEQLILHREVPDGWWAVAINPEKVPDIKRELGLETSKKGSWVQNIVTLLVLLSFGLVDFYLLQPWQAFLWFVLVLVASPVVLAFVQNAETIRGKDLVELYRIGVAQVPFIGELLASLLPTDMARHPPTPRRMGQSRDRQDRGTSKTGNHQDRKPSK